MRGGDGRVKSLAGKLTGQGMIESLVGKMRDYGSLDALAGKLTGLEDLAQTRGGGSGEVKFSFEVDISGDSSDSSKTFFAKEMVRVFEESLMYGDARDIVRKLVKGEK